MTCLSTPEVNNGSGNTLPSQTPVFLSSLKNYIPRSRIEACLTSEVNSDPDHTLLNSVLMKGTISIKGSQLMFDPEGEVNQTDLDTAIKQGNAIATKILRRHLDKS
jgi:hypothetical protein